MPFWLIMVLIFIAAVGFFTDAPVHILGKATMYAKCIWHMIASSDVKKSKDQKPVVKQEAARGRRIKVVFVRHGESVWNSLFNKFGLGWPVRTSKAFIRETLLWFTNHKDSLFIDSPLSIEGINQGQSLGAFFSSRQGSELLHSPQSVIVVSNLRRAMETASLGAAGRVGGEKQERIVIDNLLQEGTRNVDGASFCESKKLPASPMYGLETSTSVARTFDASHNDGNKSLSSNVNRRIDNFALRLFGECREGNAGYSTADGSEPQTVIAVGHSLWFRNFFNRFLPANSNHIAKKKKIENCGVVSFDIVSDKNTGELTIDENSIREHYIGFAK
jgi:broad specificity phosphatase PhoE